MAKKSLKGKSLAAMRRRAAHARAARRSNVARGRSGRPIYLGGKKLKLSPDSMKKLNKTIDEIVKAELSRKR